MPIARFLLLILLTCPLVNGKIHTFKPADGAVKQKLIALATEKVKNECASCKVTVQCKWMASVVKKSSAAAITKLFFDDPGLPTGYVTANVALAKSAARAKPKVQFYINVSQKIPVAAYTIKKGTKLQKNSVAWQWQDMARLHRRPLSQAKNLFGKSAARMIRKGHAFYPSNVLGAASFTPGDQVQMQYDEAGLQVSITCIARERKGVGQKIRLYSKETGQRYLAKIIAKNKIVWIKTL